MALRVLKRRLVSLCLWLDKEKPLPSCLLLLHLQMWNTGCSGECCIPAFSTCGFDVLVQHLSINIYLKKQEETACCTAFLDLAKENLHVDFIVFLQPYLILFFFPLNKQDRKVNLAELRTTLVVRQDAWGLWLKSLIGVCSLSQSNFSVSSWSEQFTCRIKKTLHLKPVYLSNMLPLCERVGVAGPDCTCCPDMVWAGCDIQEQMDGCK